MAMSFPRIMISTFDIGALAVVTVVRVHVPIQIISYRSCRWHAYDNYDMVDCSHMMDGPAMRCLADQGFVLFGWELELMAGCTAHVPGVYSNSTCSSAFSSKYLLAFVYLCLDSDNH